jgi:putative membrane protein
MFSPEFCNFPYWWIFPLVMIALCFFMMRRRGSSICGFGARIEKRPRISSSDTATEILDKKYALGEISREEYEEKKRAITPA